ncbi:MAG: YggT family protein [Allgaiera sp.]|jgi:YggT family protein|nr:YggT family protein [Allgaiera sp.]
MFTLLKTILLLLNVIYFVVIAHIIMSWLISFQVLNLRQPLVYQIWDGLNRLLDPIYSRIRRVLPDTGALDLAPLAVLLILIVLRMAIVDNAATFAY